MEPAPQNTSDNPYAAPAAPLQVPARPAPNVFKAWIIYALCMTVAAWLISSLLGYTVFRWLISGPGMYWLFPIINLALTLPVSYVLFRWVVRSFLFKP